jgi:hypothetical protein
MLRLTLTVRNVTLLTYNSIPDLWCRAARQPQAGGRPLQVEDPEFLELLRASGGRLVRGEPQAIVTSLPLDQGE